MLIGALPFVATMPIIDLLVSEPDSSYSLIGHTNIYT